MKKVCFFKRGQKSKKVENEEPLVVTFHSLINRLTTIKHRNLYLLYMNQEVKNIFTPGLILSFRRARKTNSYLVRVKLDPLERMVNSKICGKSRCDVCLNNEETDTFTSTTTGKIFKLKL